MLLAPVVLMLWWATRLIRWRLHKRYRVLTVFLLWTSAITVVAVFLVMTDRNEAYRSLYFTYRAAEWVLSLAVVLELFRLTVELSPALAKAGRWFANAATGAALLIGVALAAGGSAGEIERVRWFVYERSFYTAILALSLLMLGFAALFRVRERRNVIVLACVLGYMFSTSAVLWLLSDPMNLSRIYDVLLSVNMFVSLLIGILLVKPAGEEIPEQILNDGSIRDLEPEIVAQLERTTRQLAQDAKKGLEDPPSGD